MKIHLDILETTKRREIGVAIICNYSFTSFIMQQYVSRVHKYVFIHRHITTPFDVPCLKDVIGILIKN